jgi:competence protein ComEA
MKHQRNTLAALLALATVLLAIPAMAADEPSEPQTKQVNINTAGASELALLPRVGPALSERIITFRDENGEFSGVEDLILVRGIGEKTFAMMKPFVKVSGDTTLSSKVRTSDLPQADAAPQGSSSKGSSSQGSGT